MELLSNLLIDQLLRVAGILFILGVGSWFTSELIFIGSRWINYRRAKERNNSRNNSRS